MSFIINYEKDMIARFNGLHPTEVRGQSNFNNLYQKKYLLNKIYSNFDIDFGEKLKGFDLNTFRFMLFYFGSTAIFHKDDYIYYAFYGVEKWNIYHNPSRLRSELLYDELRSQLQVNNQEVNKDCVIIKAFDNYTGFADLLNDYAEILASFDKTIKVALLNANVNLLAFAKDRKQAEEIRTAYALATQGTPMVIMDKNLEPGDNKDLFIPLTSHDIIASIDKLLTSRRAVVNNFLTEVGINNANINKKERLITDEANANNEEVKSVIEVVADNIKEGVDTCNEIFGTFLKIKLKKPKEVKEPEATEGGEEDV